MDWSVYFYQTKRGDYPVKKFIEEQDYRTQARIAKSIRLLVDHGPFLKSPHTKKLQGKLYELRISGNVAIRILYLSNSNAYYLLHVFKKKTQKTPAHELKVAFDRMKEFI